MSCLYSCFYTTRNIAFASLPDNTKSNHSPPPVQTHSLKPTTTILPRKQKKKKPQKPRQPSVIEIERAIGAGRFRDTDSRELEEQKNAKFDMLMMNFPGKFEGTLEKKLRETGELMANRSERGQKNSDFRVQVDASGVDTVTPGCLWSHQATIQFPFSGSTDYVNIVTSRDYTTKHLFKAIQALAECYPFDFTMQKSSLILKLCHTDLRYQFF